MKLLKNHTLQELIETRGEALVSIYIPTERVGQRTEQNPIRLKNQLAKAENLLKESGLRQTDVDAILNPARELVEQRSFWQTQSKGLALYLSAEKASFHQLPLDFEERVEVGKRFLIKPLLPLLSGDGRFYLLNLGMEEPTLYQGSRYALETVEVPEMPSGIEDALRFDDPEKQLQHQTTTRTEGGHDAIHHGHGDNYNKKENVLRYFYQVENAVTNLLGEESAPLLLAGINYLLPIYRETNQYPYLLDGGIGQDVTRMQSDELHQRAWEIVMPHFQQAQKDARDRYYIAREQDLAAHKLEEIVPAAYYSRVDTLFVASGEQRWGIFDRETGAVKQSSEEREGQDLLDFAVVHALAKRAKVYALAPGEVPDGGVAAAILRY